MTPADRRPRRFQKIPEDSRCSGFPPCVSFVIVLFIFRIASCHHAIMSLISHLNLNKSCGSSIHLNRGKCDFSLKHILPIFRELYYKIFHLFGINPTHLHNFPHAFSTSSFTVKTLPSFPFNFIEVPPKFEHFWTLPKPCPNSSHLN